MTDLDHSDLLVIVPLRIPLTQSFSRGCRTVFTSLRLCRPDEADTESAERWHLPLGLETAPVIGVLLLLASTCIPGSVIRDGIVGSGGVRPYDIMTLFISFVSARLPLCETRLI